MNPSFTGTWDALLDALRPLEREFIALTGDDPSGRMALRACEQLLGALVHGVHSWMVDDPRQPRFQLGYSPVIALGAPNTDTIYSFASVDGTGCYRLSGTRGTSHFMNLSMGEFWQMHGRLTPRYGNHSFDSLALDADGRFEVVVSPERPQGYEGDWWQLDPRVEALGIRQVFYDWERETDGIVTIERLDVPSPVAPRTPADLARRIADLATWTRGETLMWIEHLGRMRQKAEANRLVMEDYSDRGGLPSQIYYEGRYEFEADEALIIEVEPPRCHYWAMQVTDPAFGGVDWVNYQSSINGRQATLDSDGVFRAVVALTDPGVANWLDPVGNDQGWIQGRWHQSDAAPLPTITRVPLAALDDHLPADTPRIDAPTRDRQLRARRLAAQRRRLC